MESIPYIAILIAFALIYSPRAVVGREMKRLAGGYDNANPRDQQALLVGLGKRALGAHNNSFETFAPFAAGALAAAARSSQPEIVAIVAIAFVVSRAGYILAYLGDFASLRSALWTLGMLCIGGLMLLAIMH